MGWCWRGWAQPSRLGVLAVVGARQWRVRAWVGWGYLLPQVQLVLPDYCKRLRAALHTRSAGALDGRNHSPEPNARDAALGSGALVHFRRRVPGAWQGSTTISIC